MRLVAVRIENFRCFEDSGWLEFGPRRNLIVGENSSGKSSTLAAISLQFANEPHRSYRDASLSRPNLSNVDFRFALSQQEVQDLPYVLGQILVPADSRQIPGLTPAQWWATVTARPELIFTMRRVPGNSNHPIRYPAFELFEASGGPNHIVVTPELNSRTPTVSGWGSGGADFGAAVADHFARSIYFFSPERIGLASCAAGQAVVLQSNASNLAEVLQNLQSNRTRFDQFMTLVQKVLPEIKHISVRNMGSGRVEIFVSRHDDPRDDLYQSLSASGTGAGQVLAITYVLHSAREPRTVLIDEPNLYLHPRAVRRLVDVLKSYPKHQFVVTTHSPEIISTLDPDYIYISRWTGDGSSIVKEAGDALANTRNALAEVGARLSDLYGADQILWVEGVTEEICVPVILKALLEWDAPGTVVRGVIDTGRIRGRDKRLILEVYSKLSIKSYLVPEAVGFVLDREALSESDVNDLLRQSGGQVHVIARRSFENYLLHPAAVAKVLQSLNPQAGSFGAATISDWVTQNCTDKKLSVGYAPWSAEWVRAADASQILAAVFQHFASVEYDKPKHGLALTHALLEIDATSFAELAKTLQSALAGQHRRN